MPLFFPERAAIGSLVNQGRLHKRGFQVVAVAALVIPIFATAYLDKFTKGCFLITGVTAAACWRVTEKTVKHQEQIDKAYEQEQVREFQRHGKITAKFQEAIATINGYNQLTEKIMRQPTWQWQRWVEQFGLKGLLPRLEQVAPAQEVMPDWTAQAIAPSNITSVERIAPVEPPASIDWIISLVESTAEPDPEKRRNHHIVIQGPTQYGKSTLCSFILILLAKRLTVLGLDLKIHLIDPKYPMSKWFIEPGFKGYEEVYEGVTGIRKELESRKKVFVAAKQQKKTFPRVGFYASITDEWDNIWSEGQGYGSGTVITKDEVKEIKATELTLFKEGAAFNMCGIIMGQSPLKESSGFNHSDLNNATRIVLGIEALKWLKHQAFPFKDMADSLETEMRYWIARGERVALVIPNNGLPFVAPVPREVKQVVESFEAGQDILAVESVEQPEEPETSADWYEKLQDWVTRLPKDPSTNELAAKFQQLTGKALDVGGLEYLTEEVRAWRSGDR